MKQEIWNYYRGFQKVYVESYLLKKKLEQRKDCKLSCLYFHPDGKRGWDFIFPYKKHNAIVKLLKSPSKAKHINRVSNTDVKNRKRYDFTQTNSSNFDSKRCSAVDAWHSMPFK